MTTRRRDVKQTEAFIREVERLLAPEPEQIASRRRDGRTSSRKAA